MKNSYMDKFNILTTFKNNEYQNIFIGANVENPKDIVVINILNNKNLLDPIARVHLKDFLTNIVHFEETEDKLIMVTRFKEALPLAAYIQQLQLPTKEKLGLAYQYLKEITRYDRFNHFLKNILVDEGQIIIENGKLSFNELILIDESPLEILPHPPIMDKVASTLSSILFSDTIQNPNHLDTVPVQTLQFIEVLGSQPEKYKTFSEVFEDFKKYYIHDLILLNNGPMGTTVPTPATTIGRSQKKNLVFPWKKSYTKVVSAVLATAVLAYALLFTPLIDSVKETLQKEPTAFFEKIEMKGQWQLINKSSTDGKNNTINSSVWEISKDQQLLNTYHGKDLTLAFSEAGTYQVALKVKDTNEKWSQPYTETITVENKEIETSTDAVTPTMTAPAKEQLDDLTIVYLDPEHVQKDDTLYKSGQSSIRFGGVEGKSTGSITLPNLNLEKTSTLSLWLMSNEVQDIQLEIEGYYKSKLSFKKTIFHNPASPDSWEMISIHDPIEKSDEIKLTVHHANATVWIDEIQFDMYK